MEATTKDHLPPRVGAIVSISIQHFTHQSLLGYHALWIDDQHWCCQYAGVNLIRTTNETSSQVACIEFNKSKASPY
jgi:hypothetical protein